MTDRKYTGILGQPRPVITIITSMMGNALAEHGAACLARDAALFEEFNIDRRGSDPWRDLAFALAEEHVPAYKIRKPGRPKVNTDEDVALLHRWQAIKRSKQKCSDADAVRQMATEMEMPLDVIHDRIKRMKGRKLEPYLSTLDQIQAEIGREKLVEALTPSPDTDDGLEVWIERRLLQLYRPPYE